MGTITLGFCTFSFGLLCFVYKCFFPIHIDCDAIFSNRVQLDVSHMYMLIDCTQSVTKFQCGLYKRDLTLLKQKRKCL
ncbi:Hypothetical predicted protein [Octopus vulgaris]|uniref:Uncharacterized protein n=1 Tax=Octopus vulgaris TaxID=6645 RepID=A0AA36F4P6_OCTVU|nr:Hypothetical predicted protein [Octopus vulgaris]